MFLLVLLLLLLLLLRGGVGSGGDDHGAPKCGLGGMTTKVNRMTTMVHLPALPHYLLLNHHLYR